MGWIKNILTKWVKKKPPPHTAIAGAIKNVGGYMSISDGLKWNRIAISSYEGGDIVFSNSGRLVITSLSPDKLLVGERYNLYKRDCCTIVGIFLQEAKVLEIGAVKHNMGHGDDYFVTFRLKDGALHQDVHISSETEVIRYSL